MLDFVVQLSSWKKASNFFPADSKQSLLKLNLSKNHNNQKYVLLPAWNFLSLTSLDTSDVDTVWTWGKNVPPPISYYFSKFFSPSHIKLTDNKPNKGLKLVERTKKVDKILFRSQNIFGWKIEKSARDSNAWTYS